MTRGAGGTRRDFTILVRAGSERGCDLAKLWTWLLLDGRWNNVRPIWAAGPVFTGSAGARAYKRNLMKHSKSSGKSASVLPPLAIRGSSDSPISRTEKKAPSARMRTMRDADFAGIGNLSPWLASKVWCPSTEPQQEATWGTWAIWKEFAQRVHHQFSRHDSVGFCRRQESTEWRGSIQLFKATCGRPAKPASVAKSVRNGLRNVVDCLKRRDPTRVQPR